MNKNKLPSVREMNVSGRRNQPVRGFWGWLFGGSWQ